MEISAGSSGVAEREILEEIDGSQELTNQVARAIFSNYPLVENSHRTIKAAVERDPNLAAVVIRLLR